MKNQSRDLHLQHARTWPLACARGRRSALGSLTVMRPQAQARGRMVAGILGRGNLGQPGVIAIIIWECSGSKKFAALGNTGFQRIV